MDELTTLYRRLSKEAHPDLYPANERSLRTLVMQQINDAYRRKDLESLRQFSQQYPQPTHIEMTQTKAEELARKQRLEEESRQRKEAENRRRETKIRAAEEAVLQQRHGVTNRKKERTKEEVEEILSQAYNMKFDVDKIMDMAKTLKDTLLRDGTYLTEDESLSIATLLMMQEGK